MTLDRDPQVKATQYRMEQDEHVAHLQDRKRRTLSDILGPRRLGPVSTESGLEMSPRGTENRLISCRWHGTQRLTPAMAAKIAGHPRMMGELLAEAECELSENPPGSYSWRGLFSNRTTTKSGAGLTGLARDLR
jgi:hypothetical protein